MIWIVALAVLALAVWAFWPRRRGVVDNEVRKGKWKVDGKGDYFGGIDNRN